MIGTVVQLDGQKAKTILVVYTHSSSKKSWFSVKEIQISARTSVAGSECPDGQRWDPILGECKEIMEDTDEGKVDNNGVMFWDDEVGSYLSQNTTFSRNFRTDGSMRMDVEKKDMGGKWRPDKEVVVFLKVSGKNPKEEVSGKFDGGPHNDKNPELARCYDVGVSFDMKRLRLRKEMKHPDYEDAEELDISKLNLPAIVGRYYGFCFTDRRVLRDTDKKIMGRILSVRVNPSPFDFNRNVLNDNWIDIGAFLDKGQYKDKKGKLLPILEKPFDPEQYTDTIRVDGQDAATFGFRFFRYCQIEPIIAQDEEDMDRIFSEIREEFEEDAPVAETNLAGVEVGDIPKVIAIGKEDDFVKLHANLKPNPLITKVQWRQSSGNPIPLPEEMLNSAEVSFPYKKAYGTTEWTFSAHAQGGITVFERTIKILDAIDQTKDYVRPVYPDSKTAGQYHIERNYKLESSEMYASGKTWNNSEVTYIMNIGKEKTAFPYAINIGAYGYNIFPDGKFEPHQTENLFPYMVNVPTLKGKKIGLKVITQTTDMERPEGLIKATLIEVHLCLDTVAELGVQSMVQTNSQTN